MARWRGAGLLLQTLVCWTLLEHCCGGPRPHQRGGPARHPRHPDRWTHGTQNQAQHDRGSQRIEYPSLGDKGGWWLPNRGQEVVYPSLNDNDGSGQVQVNSRRELVVVVVVVVQSSTLGRV